MLIHGNQPVISTPGENAPRPYMVSTQIEPNTEEIGVVVVIPDVICVEKILIALKPISVRITALLIRAKPKWKW